MTNRPRRVLIVDDERDIREVLRLNFELEGWVVREWSTGADVLTEIESFQPDWLVLDLRMPGVDGWSVLRSLRSDPATVALPVAVVTGESDIEHVFDGWEPGLFEHLQKPFSPSVLVEIGARAGTAAAVAGDRALALLASLDAVDRARE